MEPPCMISVDLARPTDDATESLVMAYGIPLQAPPSPAHPSPDDARPLPAARASSGSNRPIVVQQFFSGGREIDFSRISRQIADVFRRKPRLSHHFGSHHFGPRAIDLPASNRAVFQRMRDEIAVMRIRGELDRGFNRLEHRMAREHSAAERRLDALADQLRAVRVA